MSRDPHKVRQWALQICGNSVGKRQGRQGSGGAGKWRREVRGARLHGHSCDFEAEATESLEPRGEKDHLFIQEANICLHLPGAGPCTGQRGNRAGSAPVPALNGLSV